MHDTIIHVGAARAWACFALGSWLVALENDCWSTAGLHARSSSVSRLQKIAVFRRLSHQWGSVVVIMCTNTGLAVMVDTRRDAAWHSVTDELCRPLLLLRSSQFKCSVRGLMFLWRKTRAFGTASPNPIFSDWTVRNTALGKACRQ